MEKDVCWCIFYSGSSGLSVYGKLWGQLLPETIFLLSGSAGGEGEHGRSKGVVSGTGGENQRDSTGRAGGYGAFGPGKTGAGKAAMEKLGEEYPALSGCYPVPKPVMVSWILAVQQLCGVYSPFTVEANYNWQMTGYNIPHTICHELSHLRGFMREDEANFIGILACTESDDAYFRYSGYLMAWVHAGNALAKADVESFYELHSQLCGQAVQDLQENNKYWDQYEGKVAEVSNQVNDTYLKLNDQKDGVQSYGRVVDLMLAMFLQNRQEAQ